MSPDARAERPRALAAFAVLVAPVLATGTASRGFDPPKSLALAVAVAALAACSRAAGEPWSLGPRVHELGRFALRAAGAWALLLAAAALLSADRWTALLGGDTRRQGLVTEWSELAVFAAAIFAASRGALDLSTIFRWVAVGAGGAAAAAVCQSYRVGRLDPTEWNSEILNRVAGPMGSASQLSTYLALTLPPTLALLAQAIGRRERAASAGALVSVLLQGTALVFARGRSGVLGAVAGAAVVGLLAPTRTRLGRAVKGALLAASLGFAGLVVLINVPGNPLESYVKERAVIPFFLDRLSLLSRSESGTIRVRVLVGESFEKSLASRPAAWAVGFGPDAYWESLASFDTEERRRLEGGASSPDRPHSFVGEKILTAGVGAAALWLGLLSLALGAGLARTGTIRRSGRAAILLFAAGVAGFALTWIAKGSCALAPAAAAAAAAGVALLIAFVRGVALLLRPSDERDGILAVGCVAALVAHLAAGSVGVSMLPERVLLFVLAGVILGNSPGAEPAAPRPRDGLLLGAAAAAILPMYAFYGFGWDAPKTVYAAVLVPPILLALGAALLEGARARIVLQSLGVLGAGAVVLAICIRASSGRGPDAMEHHGAFAAMTPAVLGVVLLAAVAAAGRLAPLSRARGDRLGAAALALLALLLAWEATGELRSDSAKLAALRLNGLAVEVSKEAAARRSVDLDRRARELDRAAHRSLDEARAIVTPMRLLGAPAPLDRVLPAERP